MLLHFSSRSLFLCATNKLCRQITRRVKLKQQNVFSASLCSKTIYTTSTLNVKLFTNTENSFAYNIIKDLPVINHNLYKTHETKPITLLEEFNSFLDQNWRSKSACEIVDAFKAVANFCIENNIDVSDRRFDKLVDGLMDRVLELTDAELSELLVCLRKYPVCLGVDAHNFHDIWSALDDVCCTRIPNLSHEARFLFAEHWYLLNLGKLGDYLYYFIDRLIKHINQLTKDELLYLTYLLGVSRRHKVAFEVQNEWDKHVNAMTIQELALISNTFVKLRAKPKFSNTVENLISRLNNELPNVEEFYIEKIVEFLRYSTHTLFIDKLLDLLDNLVPEVDRLSNLCCIHIILLGTTLQFFHKESLKKISQKLVRDINDPEKIRVKDMERLLVPLTMFNYDPETNPDIFDVIFKEIHTEQRRREFITYQRCLPSILNQLSLRKLYSHKLLNEILNMENISELYGKNAKIVPHEIFNLDISVRVECPDYTGNRLDDTFLKKGVKWNCEYAPTRDQYKKLSKSDQFYLEVVETVEEVIGGRQNLHIDHILVSFVKADIIVCVDNEGNFKKPEGFNQYTLGDIMRPPNTSYKWFAIIPLNWNADIKNTNEPLGIVHMKCRQLKAIGYEPILVHWHEFRLPECNKSDYIKRKLVKYF